MPSDSSVSQLPSEITERCAEAVVKLRFWLPATGRSSLETIPRTRPVASNSNWKRAADRNACIILTERSIMDHRRAFLASIAGAGTVSTAGCTSDGERDDLDDEGGTVDENGAGDESSTGDETGAEESDDDSGDDSGDVDAEEERSIAIGLETVLEWFPAETVRPRFLSFELLVADGELAADELPAIGGEPILAEVEFTEMEGYGTEGTARRLYFVEDEPETLGENQDWYDAMEYGVVIDAGLDRDQFVGAYEGQRDPLRIVDEDARRAFGAVTVNFEVLGLFGGLAEPYPAVVTSTDGERGEIAVVFDQVPDESSIEAVEDDFEGEFGDVRSSDGRLVVIEYSPPKL